MVRYMGDDTGELWRAVFAWDSPHGVHSATYGPYERRQDAAGMITRMSRYHRNPVEKYIEKTSVKWERVE